MFTEEKFPVSCNEVATRRQVRVGFDIYWLRETPAGRLHGEFGLRLPADVDKTVTISRFPDATSLARVTVSNGGCDTSVSLRAKLAGYACQIEDILNQALRARVLTLLPGSAEELPPEIRIAVHVPFSGRRAPRKDMFPPVQFDPSGAIYFGDPGRLQCLTLAAGPLVHRGNPQPAAPWGMRYSFTHAFPAQEALGPVVRSVLDRHRTAISLPETSGDLSLTWLIALDPSAAPAWCNLPAPHSASFSRIMHHTMFAVQYALRTFVPFHYFLDVRRFASRGRAWSMLVYSAMRPVLARSAHCYGYDVLDPTPIRSALRWASRPLRSRLRYAHQRILAAGNVDWIRNYPICDRGRIIRAMSDLPRHFRSLLSGENRILNLVRLMAESAHRMSIAAPSKVGVVFSQFAARRFYDQLALALNRLYSGDSFGHLAPLVALAATWGLANAQGLRPKMDLHLRIREIGGPLVHAWRRPISYANPRRRPALQCS
ncbi:MAG: hypothetical protein R2762_17700 [Bryobacteraceae bacterium]